MVYEKYTYIHKHVGLRYTVPPKVSNDSNNGKSTTRAYRANSRTTI